MDYSFDTSAILHMYIRHYPPSNFPSLWEKITDSIKRGVIKATEEVLFELEKKDDEAHRWAMNNEDMFIEVDEDIQYEVRNILSAYPRLVDTRRNRSMADPFVIALAVLHDCTVITGENPTNRIVKPNIPDVCKALNIPCISPLDLIKELNWII